MFSDFINRVQGISLKWKLLIPFLFFSFIGTTSLVYIGLSSQQEMIKEEEKKELFRYYDLFLASVRQKGDQALSMATIISENPTIKQLLSKRDRKGLLDYTSPLFEELKKDFGIRQLHFHILPGKSFLRVHMPDLWGEMIAYRTSIMDALKSGKGKMGLEWGLTGLGMRGVSPVSLNNKLLGSLEIGYPFGRLFLQNFKEYWGPDFAVYEKEGPNTYALLASTNGPGKTFSLTKSLIPDAINPVRILIAPSEFPNLALLVGPIRDYRDEVVALVEIKMNRSAIITRLSRTKALMIIVGLVSICISFFLVWVVAVLFIRPIREIVVAVQEIAQGKRETRLKPGPNDEIGLMSHSINTMLNSLKERRLQIEDYAKTLEQRVQERTADLVSSEEKHRTLVDNLPLGVYRILNDGTIEFINPYLVNILGFSPDDVVGHRFFWQTKIWRCNKAQGEKNLGTLLEDARGFREERAVKDNQGHEHIFMDQAIPFCDESGKVLWFEGIMVDITELKRLQEKALRTEEVRLLGEISARFAHEMRNPLATVGGFARRLQDTLTENEREKRFAKIIVDEVARMEELLKSILASIKPFSLNIVTVDLNKIILSSLDEEAERMATKKINLDTALSPSIPDIQGDSVFLKRAFGCILKNEVINMPEGETLSLATGSEVDNVVTIIRHDAKGLANEDLTQFFFPRFTGKAETTIHDLPLAKAVINRHGGKVDVFRDGEDVVLKIKLPIVSSV
ncbi:MAG: PAS domain S-box protein [Deltaproteobacteria bacterium]|nr:PAS domain S-box protein [Deltaproteobacteria bacterium]